MNRRALGTEGETAACEYLSRRGWKILDRNARIGRGEIDIIAQKRRVIAFIEVKRRTTNQFGTPAEAVNAAKQRKIITAAALYMQQNNLQNANVRFDVIELTPDRINHIQNAFDATDLY